MPSTILPDDTMRNQNRAASKWPRPLRMIVTRGMSKEKARVPQMTEKGACTNSVTGKLKSAKAAVIMARALSRTMCFTSEVWLA